MADSFDKQDKINTIVDLKISDIHESLRAAHVEVQEIKADIKEVKDTIQNVDKNLALFQQKFDIHTEHEESYYKELKEITNTMSRNTSSLEEHIRRTEVLEKSLIPINEKYRNDLLKEEVRLSKSKDLIFIIKLLSGVSALIGILTFIYKVVI